MQMEKERKNTFETIRWTHKSVVFLSLCANNESSLFVDEIRLVLLNVQLLRL